MWYLFAPLIGLFEGNILIFYGVRLIMAACSLWMLYLVYKIIKNYLADDIAAWGDAVRTGALKGLPRSAKFYMKNNAVCLAADGKNILMDVN